MPGLEDRIAILKNMKPIEVMSGLLFYPYNGILVSSEEVAFSFGDFMRGTIGRRLVKSNTDFTTKIIRKYIKKWDKLTEEKKIEFCDKIPITATILE